jgi:hypothetical protein
MKGFVVTDKDISKKIIEEAIDEFVNLLGNIHFQLTDELENDKLITEYLISKKLPFSLKKLSQRVVYYFVRTSEFCLAIYDRNKGWNETYGVINYAANKNMKVFVFDPSTKTIFRYEHI